MLQPADIINMSSYTDKRSKRGKPSSGYQKVGNDGTLPSNEMQDVDRLSMIGSVNSSMSTSVLERKLGDAQRRVQYLEALTKKQQSTIDRLWELVNRRKS